MSQTAQRDHAVVIGAGMAGLTTATALAAAFERVTVLDRDQLPGTAEHRGGVPQGRHVHVLLGAGAEALEALFPGLLDDLVGAGAPTGDTDRFRMWINGHRLARGRTGHHSVTATRPFVEAHVRDRVRRDPVITITDGCDVRGVVAGPDGRRVIGVRVGASAETGEQTLPADLVVDCSGRRGHRCRRGSQSSASPSPRSTSCASTCATRPTAITSRRRSTTTCWSWSVRRPTGPAAAQ